MLGQRDIANKMLVGKDLAAKSVSLLVGEGWWCLDVEICGMVLEGNRAWRVLL